MVSKVTAGRGLARLQNFIVEVLKTLYFFNILSQQYFNDDFIRDMRRVSSLVIYHSNKYDFVFPVHMEIYPFVCVIATE